MKKKILIVIAVALVLVAACTGALFVGIMGATQPLADAGEKFMTSLKDGNYRQAFDMGSPGFQKETKDAAGLEKIVKDGDAQPAEWSFSSRNMLNDTGKLAGSVTLTGGRPGSVSVSLAKVGNEWKISGFNLREN